MSNSICFFASFYTADSIPYYMQIYLKELKRHFFKVVLLSSKVKQSPQDILFCEKENIDYQFEVNEGFDFGMWYKSFQRFDVTMYDKIALVNDSCILFKSLDEFMKWSLNDTSDAQGITISEAVSKHIQSYFIVLNKKAITLTAQYFDKHKILNSISDVIETYEIGLSKFFIERDLTVGAFVDNNGYRGEFSPYYYCIDYHLSNKMPLIKKKILFESYRKDELFTLARMNFNISPEYYVGKIKQKSPDLLIDLERVADGTFVTKFTLFEKIKYILMCKLVQFVKRFLK